jgi:hypothetical protein
VASAADGEELAVALCLSAIAFTVRRSSAEFAVTRIVVTLPPAAAPDAGTAGVS